MEKRKTKEFIFTIARMNPPTIGHKHLIQQMVQRALATRVDKVHIILSSKTDETNPLPCDKKREIITELTKGIRGVNIMIVCMDDPTDVERCGSHPILKSICHAISNATSDATSDDRYTNATLFIGDDRETSYDWIGTALAKNNPPIEVELVSLDRKVNPISATKIRDLVKEGDYDGFMTAYHGSGLGQETLDNMYSLIQKPSVSKKTSVSKKSRATAKHKSSTRKKKTSSSSGSSSSGGGKRSEKKRSEKKRRKRNSSNKRNKSFR
jgi:hypothetical protein